MTMHGLVQGDVISGNIAFNGFYELGLSRRIASHARKGGLFVDVGANMGYFTLLWAGLGPGNVVAIEPAPRNVELLANNVARNGLSERVYVLARAAADRNGEVHFREGPHEQTGWGGITNERRASDFTVPSTTLDHEFDGREIRVLKIDVEGADTVVLRGCEALLRRQCIGQIYFEQNIARMLELGLSAAEAPQLLRDCGYEVTPIDATGTEWSAFPRQTGMRT